MDATTLRIVKDDTLVANGFDNAKLDGRFWLTVKGARFLGYDVPKEAKDDEAVVFVRITKKDDSQ